MCIRLLRSRALREGAEIVGGSPQALDALIRTEHERWGKLVRNLGLRKD